MFVIFWAENYERLEADKKRHVHTKRQCVGSVIRYHSVVMPLVSDLTFKEENVDVEGYFICFLISYWMFTFYFYCFVDFSLLLSFSGCVFIYLTFIYLYTGS